MFWALSRVLARSCKYIMEQKTTYDQSQVLKSFCQFYYTLFERWHAAILVSVIKASNTIKTVNMCEITNGRNGVGHSWQGDWSWRFCKIPLAVRLKV